jgi:hypothetical protein
MHDVPEQLAANAGEPVATTTPVVTVHSVAMASESVAIVAFNLI